MTRSKSSQEAMEEEEGRRIAQLRQVFEKALEKSLRPCTFEKLSKCYPTLAQTKPELLRLAAHQAKEYLRKTSTESFDRALEQRELVARVNELEEMTTRARRGEYQAQTFVPYPREPQRVLAASSVPPKREELARLQASLRKMEKEVDGAKTRVMRATEECKEARQALADRQMAIQELKHATEELEKKAGEEIKNL
ncbi:hypothetical protein BJ684DRAFT_15799 [Piptocephalis cylindrospora]|uniref:Nnf1-domain-containing protein n=1 Tax=Piptocephalis cylindrospora TaxID=1907219 RepID=A0A4P9Y7G2_9FUNG|nr:hypothetical protein BJ684DRAFT_15799 [Piptocephalis cylindrospora]|eukprot:RKP13840.1 hypothetical protein BJ684DRAFT_15799 [Piptocephalis cylindrospora]